MRYILKHTSIPLRLALLDNNVASNLTSCNTHIRPVRTKTKFVRQILVHRLLEPVISLQFVLKFWK